MTDTATPLPTAPRTQPPAWRGWIVFFLALAATFLLGLLAASVIERRGEARIRAPLQEIGTMETDSSVWGKNYPREYHTYLKMRDPGKQTRYGGSAQRDYLEEVPTNVILFAGYPFSSEYLQGRGHLYAVQDILDTERIGPKTPATCWTCKSPDALRLISQMGPEKYYASSFAELKSEIRHPIGCLDCHEPNTMRLRVMRPALLEAFKRQGRNIDDVSHQEMRTLVCAQCHVEYYFQGEGKYLTFPWDKGTRPEEMEEYYDQVDFSDWTHAISKAPMLKMQHPDYEIYSTGIHAYRGVSCADCHMPYRTEGGVKFTDHHIQSPLLNVAASCAVCHRWTEDEIRSRVETIQDKVREGRDRAEDMIGRAHFDIAAAMQAGAADEQLNEVRRLVRQAQMRWDYVAANNGLGFHSPQEAMRILAAAIDLAGRCRIECARILALRGVTDPVRYPEYDTKQKAQALIQQFIDGNPPKLIAGNGD